MSFLDDISQCIGFNWDEGNIKKNWEKHRVSPMECEQVFFNRPHEKITQISFRVRGTGFLEQVGFRGLY